MSQTVWQGWEMYVHTWNLGWNPVYESDPPDPPLEGYRKKDIWNRETYFLPYPPSLSEEGRKQARAVAQAQWVRWKAEEDKRREKEEKKRREHEAWRADFSRRLKAEEEEKQRKKQEAKDATARKLQALAVRPPEKRAAKKKEPSRAKPPRYWLEFLVAPSCGRPPLASWDPANKTYTLPLGVKIPSVQEGWEEELKNYEAFIASCRKRSWDKTWRTTCPMVRRRGGN